jgi:hypothetical protein
MRLLEWLTEAYTRPLDELRSYSVQPVRDGRVTCPRVGRVVTESDCVSCPRFVRTHTFQGADGMWLQPVVVCDAAAADSDIAAAGS